MITKNKNFAFTSPVASDGDEYEDCNFSQLYPHTELFKGVSGLKFTRCNIRNCDLPADAELIECTGVGLHMSRCSNKHPEWVEFGLTACPENCEHVIDSDVITVDGVVIDTIYHYQDKRVE